MIPILEVVKKEMTEKLPYLQYFFPSDNNEKEFLEKL